MAFVAKLDQELDKIEKFYLAREQEARDRGQVLRDQLRELSDHRRVFYVRFLPSFWIDFVV